MINANKSNVTASGNTTSNFRGPTIIVGNPSVPARVFGNVAISDNPKDTAADVDGAEDSTATNVLKKTADIDKSRFPDAPTWPLLSSEHGGETFHTLANTGKQVTVEEGLWKLVVTYGETRTYALFHTKDDPQSKNDLSVRLEQITFRLRGLMEQQENLQFRTAMRSSGPGGKARD